MNPAGGIRRYYPHLGATLVLASSALVGFLGKWESGAQRQLTVYADALAGGLPTVCHGITRHVTNTPVIVGQRWTEQQCIREETQALVRVQHRVALCFRRPPPVSVFEMAGSHAWNLGAAATCASGAMQAWNRGEWALGCERISRGDDGRLVWAYTSHIDKATGQKVFTFRRGLANRRAEETQVCLKDVT